MKKILAIFLLVLLLRGCATYKFQRGQKPYDQGYVAYRDNYPIPEYTAGKDNSVPLDLDLAKQRFKRRRDTVEEYYKKMGSIKNPFKEYFWDYPATLVKFIVGQFQLPFFAMSERRYERDPKYRAEVDKKDQEKEAQEYKRLAKIKSELNSYIQKDLAAEPPEIVLASSKKSEPAQIIPEQKTEKIEEKPMAIETPPAIQTAQIVPPEPEKIAQEAKIAAIEPEKVAAQEKPVEKAAGSKEPEPREVKPEPTITELSKQPAPVVEAPKKKTKQLLIAQPKAVIVARPAKGYSPLIVHFSGSRSHSPQARIIAYSWDFGDGDTSTKENPVNTYYSTSFEPRQFTVTLTVHDSKGNTATVSTAIEVLNK